MALIKIEMRSSALNKSTKIRLLLNENAKPPYPVFYLLHGLSDDESDWTRRTSIERYAAQYPFLIVMPDGGRGFYCNSLLGAYETYIVKELLPFINRTFPVRRQRRFHAIGGLSMGGYGAMKLGLKFPKLFGAIASHSGAFYAGWPTSADIDRIPEMGVIFGETLHKEECVYHLADACPKKDLPRIYFDCGRDDFLIAQNEKFHRHLNQRKIPHTFKRFAGVHNWEYWDEHIQDALRFLAG